MPKQSPSTAGRSHQRWNHEDDLRVCLLYPDIRVPVAGIAAVLGRTEDAVRHRANQMGLHRDGSTHGAIGDPASAADHPRPVPDMIVDHLQEVRTLLTTTDSGGGFWDEACLQALPLLDQLDEIIIGSLET